MQEKILKKFILDDTVYDTSLPAKYLKRKPYAKEDKRKITAFIPGLIVKIYVSKGSKVKAGDRLLVLEAMKMKNDVNSPIDGVIKDVAVKENLLVPKGQLLIELE